MFRVDPKTVTRWSKAGKLAAIRTLGGHRRFREAEVRALLARDGGSSAVEYGLLVAAVAALLVGVTFGLGAAVSSTLDRTCLAIQTGMSVEGGCGRPVPSVTPDPASDGLPVDEEPVGP